MSPRDLLLLYCVAGVACAIAVLRREAGAGGLGARAVWSAMATVPLWPLWAPFVLATPRSQERGPRDRSEATVRIEEALNEAVKAVAGSPLHQMFSRQVAERIAAEVAVVAARMKELEALASSKGLDRVASAKRLEDLITAGAPERTVATARLQHESLVRLEELRAADAQALDELADLLEALRAQLLLARYAGSSADGTGAIVNEVWARLEGLGAAFEAPAGA